MKLQDGVTPYAGVWIEIVGFNNGSIATFVTPYAGVWIEIHKKSTMVRTGTSLPTRECGLKS